MHAIHEDHTAECVLVPGDPARDQYPYVAAEAGDLWRIRLEPVLVTGAVRGDAHRTDHPPLPGTRSYAMLVRAFSMKAALAAAGADAFIDFQTRDAEGRFCGMRDVDGEMQPREPGTVGYCGPRCRHCYGKDGNPTFGLNADGVWACHADSDVMDAD